MERKGVVLCSVLALLGVVSAATGFAAEVTRIKASDIKFVSLTQSSCPWSAAFGLGLIAAAALLRAQIIIHFATGCFCCCKRTIQTGNSNWTKARVFVVSYVSIFPFSWRVTFVIAFILLITALALNDQQGEETADNGYYNSYVVKPGVFAGGAFLAALSVIFGIFYYATINTGNNTTGPCGNAPLPC